jgi:hypothetical protein
MIHPGAGPTHRRARHSVAVRAVTGVALAGVLLAGCSGGATTATPPRSATLSGSSSVASGAAPGSGSGSSSPAGARSPSPSSSAAASALAATSGSAAWRAGVARVLPVDLVPARPPFHAVSATQERACTAAVAPGWSRRENARPGTPLPEDRPTFAGSTAIAAYAWTTSAGCGDSVTVSASAPIGRYVVRVWRVGWYGGHGARLVWSSPSFRAVPRTHAAGPAVIAAGPGWRPSVNVPVAPGWVPGLYLFQLVGTGGTPGAGGWVPLVVHAPQQAPRAAALYMAPTLTWAAYNPFGGASLYRSLSGDPATTEKRRARVVALARPSVINGQRQVAEYTVPLIQTLERTGTDIDYATDTDIDATPGLLLGRAEVIVGSHAEYVTTRLYDAFEAARNTGINLAFLGGNQFYWHVRLSRAADGSPRAITLHRELAEDPLRTTNPSEVTIRWRDAPLNRPESLLVGAQYTGLGVVSPLLTLNPPGWTGWHPATTLAAAAAGEVDAPNRAGAVRTQVLAQGTTRSGRYWVDAGVTYYVAPSGAGVVDAASIDTGCVTRGSCYGLATPPATRAAMSTFVTSVVKAFATPRFGATHPVDASAGTWLNGAAFAGRYGAKGVGVSLRHDDD